MAGAEGDGLFKRAKLLSCPPWDKVPPFSIPTDCANFPMHLLHFRWVMFTLLVSSENCPGLCSVAVFMFLNASWESSDVAET